MTAGFTCVTHTYTRSQWQAEEEGQLALLTVQGSITGQTSNAVQRLNQASRAMKNGKVAGLCRGLCACQRYIIHRSRRALTASSSAACIRVPVVLTLVLYRGRSLAHERPQYATTGSSSKMSGSGSSKASACVATQSMDHAASVLSLVCFYEQA